jgi:ribosomal protein S21
MAVSVHKNENLDSALKRLHREVLREKVLEVFRNRRYFVKPSVEGVEKRREWAKQKRRRRTAARRAK